MEPRRVCNTAGFAVEEGYRSDIEEAAQEIHDDLYEVMEDSDERRCARSAARRLRIRLRLGLTGLSGQRRYHLCFGVRRVVETGARRKAVGRLGCNIAAVKEVRPEAGMGSL